MTDSKERQRTNPRKPREGKEEIAQKSRQSKYESKLSALPDRASPEAEIAWIRNHAAMSRKTRSGEIVLLSEKDIMDAPSSSAASQLQNWVNRPEEFYRQLMQMQRTKIKDGDGGDEDATAESPEIARIDEMLALIDCAVVED